MPLDKLKTEETCRIIVLGAGRARLAKVASLLRLSVTASSHESIKIEYLPCVPVFDSYEDKEGNCLRYLVGVEYLGHDATLKPPGTLLPYFDEDRENTDDKSQKRRFGAVAGLAVGSGIEDVDDVDKVGRFLETISHMSLPVETLQPSSNFSSMAEELMAYKAMTDEEKEEATRLGTMGPGKMARFVEAFAKRLIDSVIEERRKAESPDPPVIHFVATEEEPPAIPLDLDPTKNRFACRKCRLVLFGDADLQDPPHVPSRHKFSPRKHDGHSASASPCQSYFLQDGMLWMGGMQEMEGKLSCPQCEAKLGNWSWSGAQCSCGTWVVPAIQIPCSRVDVVEPFQPEFRQGTVISPVIQTVRTVEL